MHIAIDRDFASVIAGIVVVLTAATAVGQTLRGRAETASRMATIANLNARIVSWWVMCGVVLGALVWLSIRGLSIGKWVHKAGGVLMLLVFVAILLLPLLNLAKGTITGYHPLATMTPVVSIMSLNLLGKMGFGAFGGFEYVAIHAGETRSPSRTIGRSVMIAAPAIVLSSERKCRTVLPQLRKHS